MTIVYSRDPMPGFDARCAADRAAGITEWWVTLHRQGDPADGYALLLTATPTDARHGLALELAAGTLADDAAEITVTPCVPRDSATRRRLAQLPRDVPFTAARLSAADIAAINGSMRRLQ
jgi:hypothetical protein